MGNLQEGRSFWWKTAPFKFNYNYDGQDFEYTIFNPYCYEVDENCIDDGKAWALWSTVIGIAICCCCFWCRIGAACLQGAMEKQASRGGGGATETEMPAKTAEESKVPDSKD